jgi:glutathione S-transferase
METKINLYTNLFSPNGRKPVAVIHALALDVEIQMVNLPAGDQRKPEFLRVNPNGLVPALEDGDFHLWESNAIMQYLAAQKPGNSLWPDNARARADIARWQFWESAHWGRACGILNWENAIKALLKAGAPDPARVREGEDMVKRFGAILDKHLEGRSWIAAGGNALTLADFSVGAPVANAERAKIPLEGFPNIRAWYARLAAQDSWKKSAPPG